MALGQQTRMEIQKEIKEGIENAFINLQIPSPGVIRTIQEHDEFINGNGHEGAKAIILLMRQSMENIEKNFTEFKTAVEKRLSALTLQFWAIILLLIGTMIGVIFDLLTRAS